MQKGFILLVSDEIRSLNVRFVKEMLLRLARLMLRCGRNSFVNVVFRNPAQRY